MSYQTVEIRSGEQVVIRTPAGPVVVSAAVVTNKPQIYVTPPEGFTGPRVSGATTIYERQT